MIALCASYEHQLAIGFHTYGADNGGFLPPGSDYVPASVPNRGVRDSGDFWDVLNPDYVKPKEAWYCPAGAFFADDPLVHYEGYDGSDIWWEFEGSGSTSSGKHGFFSYAFLCNAFFVKDFYENIPTHLDDPPDWVLVIDYTLRRTTGEYGLTNHPGTPDNYGNWPALGTFVAIPDGTNKCTLDGAVMWAPESETELGYPGCGGQPGTLGCHIIE